jgi:hypothetical protein
MESIRERSIVIKNLSAYTSAFLQLFVHRSHSFVQTIKGVHFNIAIVSMSGKPAAPGFSFAAAGLIAATIASGQPGVFRVPVGSDDIFQVTITKITDIPPITVYQEPSQ